MILQSCPQIDHENHGIFHRGWWLGHQDRQGTIDARDRYVDSAAGRVPLYVDTRALRSFLEVCWGP